MSGIVEMQLWQFALIYLLLIVVTVIMKVCNINKIRLLAVASARMTVQLIIAGLVLSYIFNNRHPLFTLAYLVLMMGFTVFRIFSKNKGLSKKFKIIVILSVVLSGCCVLAYYICIVVDESIFNPQYSIPICGMIMGNTMNGICLGIKTFRESLDGKKDKINALLCIGAEPQKILMPFVRQALETAMIPTLNSMVGMGIVSLPGMMTGQILSGTLPTTAILYQISIMIAICTAVTMSSFGTLYFGSKTFFDHQNQIINI